MAWNEFVRITNQGSPSGSASDPIYVVQTTVSSGDHYFAADARMRYIAGVGIVAEFDSGGGNWTENASIVAAFGGGTE